MLLVIDNYDSFTYNLVQYLGALGAELAVFRNDRTSTARIAQLRPTHILVSPGPGHPTQAGISLEVIGAFCRTTPILGVCLGHQSIAHAFGGTVARAPRLMHGKTSMIHHDNKTLFAGLPNPFVATRYHSLIIKRETLPSVLEVTAWTDDGIIMGVRHKEFKIEGVQFHPESILTNAGKDLLRNFLKL